MPKRAVNRAPIASGVRLRCGTCGEGHLFKSYLKLYENCKACGQDFTITDTADGPAFFVSFLCMTIFAPLMLLPMVLFESTIGRSIGYGFMILLCSVIAILLLPPFKGVFLNLQIQHSSGEGQFIYNGTHGVAPPSWNREREARLKKVAKEKSASQKVD